MSVLYEAEYINTVLKAVNQSGESLELVAGSHSRNFPYFQDEPWDNVLLAVGAARYEQTIRSQGLVGFEFNTNLENQSAAGRIEIAGSLNDASGGPAANVQLVIEGDITGFEARQEGRLFDGLPGMRWHPFALTAGTARLQLGSLSLQFSTVAGQIEHGKLNNLDGDEFAFDYDYLSAVNLESSPYEYVWFETHALDQSILGKLLDDYLVRYASEELTLQDGELLCGNPGGVVRPAKEDDSVVLLENRVPLKLAVLRRQLVRTRGSSGVTLSGLREIFERPQGTMG